MSAMVERSILIKKAVEMQAQDEILWAVPVEGSQPITEAYLQRSLRDLHRVIEEGDMKAFDRIKSRCEP